MQNNKAFVRLVKAASLAGLACFFLLTLVYVMPLNPVKAALVSRLTVTLGLYFPQNWNLFAPVPVSENEAILVRCLTAGEASTAASAGLPSHDWQDITTPLIQRYHNHRFAAYERIHRPASSAARQVMGPPSDLRPWLEACKKGDKPACDTAEKLHKPYRESANKVLAKIASSFCLAQGDGFQKVAVRIRRTPGVPWSERFKDKKPQPEDYDAGTFPLDHQVARAGLYDGGKRS